MPKRKADESGSDYAPSDKSDVEEEFDNAAARGKPRPRSILILKAEDGEAPRHYLRNVKDVPKHMRKVLTARLKEMSEEPEDAKTLTSEFTEIDVEQEETIMDSGLVAETEDDEEGDTERVEEVKEFLVDSLREEYTPKSLAAARICWVISLI